ncbi:LemA family protein [Gemmatimonadota bacterium]
MSSEQPPPEEHFRLKVSLGILFFLLIIVFAVIAVGIVSLRSLIRHEEAVTTAWGEIETIHDRRLALITGIVREVESAGITLSWRDRWQEAREEADTASSFGEEVPAVADLDAAADRLLMEIRQSAGIDSLGRVTDDINLVTELNAQLGIARIHYNEVVREYLGQRERIPIRWFARLFGFDEVPEYLRVVLR